MIVASEIVGGKTPAIADARGAEPAVDCVVMNASKPSAKKPARSARRLASIPASDRPKSYRDNCKAKGDTLNKKNKNTIKNPLGLG
jgi:hypothetical protein